jgi:hypothetical protein
MRQSVNWELSIKIRAEGVAGNNFELCINDHCFVLQGDLIYERIEEHVMNAVRPIANDLERELRQLRHEALHRPQQRRTT